MWHHPELPRSERQISSLRVLPGTEDTWAPYSQFYSSICVVTHLATTTTDWAQIVRCHLVGITYAGSVVHIAWDMPKLIVDSLAQALPNPRQLQQDVLGPYPRKQRGIWIWNLFCPSLTARLKYHLKSQTGCNKDPFRPPWLALIALSSVRLAPLSPKGGLSGRANVPDWRMPCRAWLALPRSGWTASPPTHVGIYLCPFFCNGFV